MVSIVKTSGRVLGDVFEWLVHVAFCLRSRTLVNETGADIAEGTYLTGYPVRAGSSGKYTPIVAGEEADAIGLLYYDKPVSAWGNGDNFPDTISGHVAVLEKGPAVILDDGLPANDVEGAALNWTTIKAQAEFADYVFVQAPDTVQTGTIES